MTNQTDLRIGRWDPVATAGTTLALKMTWVDKTGAPVDLTSGVMIYVGGSPYGSRTDLTGATPYVANIANNVATVSVPVGLIDTPWRLVLGEGIVTTGSLKIVAEGTSTPGGDVTVWTDAAEVAVEVSGVVTSGGGGGGGVGFISVPILVASTVWSYIHNLGIYPVVTTYDSLDREQVGDVTYPDLSSVSVTFAAAISGTLRLNY